MKRVNIEQARKLKELGFNYEIHEYYDNKEKTVHSWYYKWNTNVYNIEELFSAPYIAEALDWIRNEKGIPCYVEHIFDDYNDYSVEYVGGYGKYGETEYTDYYKSYEEAESALLDKLLIILEESK